MTAVFDVAPETTLPYIFGVISGNIFPATIIGAIILLLLFAIISIKVKIPLPFGLMAGFLLLSAISAIQGQFVTIYYLIFAVGMAIFGFFIMGVIRRF